MRAHTGAVVATLAGLAMLAGCAGGSSLYPEGPTSKSSTKAIGDVERVGSALGWGDLRLGMYVEEVEAALGTDLPVPDLARPSVEPCVAAYATTVVHHHQNLSLAFDQPGKRGRLREITVILPTATRNALVSAAKDRFPGLRWVPNAAAPELTEETDLRPLYRTTSGELIWVVPGLGVSFGEICF